MSSANPLNIFKGPNALAQFFDPEKNPPLPLVELPEALNPLRQDGVRIFAKMLTQLPAQNVKSLPALRMLRNEPDAYRKRIIEASSGSTVLSEAMVARALWGHEDVHAYVTNKKHPDSLKLLRFFGVNVNLYGGLAQQEPYDPKGIMHRLRRMAETDSNICYPGQYHNDHNWKSHEQWTGTQIWKQLPEVRVFCSTVGTGGCAVGTGSYLKSKNPSVRIVGVCNVFGDPTPGPRHFPNFESSPFPWPETIDAFENVSSEDSYRTSMMLSRYGIIAGPSSGEALHGLLAYLRGMKSEGRLAELADPWTGEISCVFVCADLPYQYMDMYYKKLGEDEFPPIFNQNLLYCDQDHYDERWFLRPEETVLLLASYDRSSKDVFCTTPSSCVCTIQPSSPVSTPSSFISDTSSCDSMESSSSIFSLPLSPETATRVAPSMAVLDLRPVYLYVQTHILNSINIPLSLTKDDFFGDASAVEQRCDELKEALDSAAWTWRDHRSALVLCADGDTSRMASAILRAKGCEALCVEGGFTALSLYLADGCGASLIV